MSGLGANIYIILPFDDQGKMNDRDYDDKPHKDKDNEQPPTDKALLSKYLIKSKVNNYTPPKKSPKLSTSLFSWMKDLLATTIGDTKLADELYTIHKAISGRMLKYEIYTDDRHVYEDLAYRALMITFMVTKKKLVRNLPGYYKGVLDKLVDETYFKDIFAV